MKNSKLSSCMFGLSVIAIAITLISQLPGCTNTANRLSDRNDIIETINRLFIGTDQKDWLEVKKCFADEVVFDMTSMAGGEPVKMTPQLIVDGWDKGLAGLKAIHHQAGNFMVTLRDNDADLFCYGISIHYLPNPSKRDTRTFVGSYDFHLMRDGSIWKIDKFRFNLKFIEGNKDLQASVKK